MGCTLVLGGARSGKSSFAEQLTEKISNQKQMPVTYIATAQYTDEEMEKRIVRHRQQRPSEWKTVEEPLNVADWLCENQAPQVVLVDCLSLLLNNWMFLEPCSDSRFFSRLNDLVHAIVDYPHPVILVSNEVGQGIVPADGLTRQYRDWLGLLNQAVAKQAESVYLVVAGIPVDVRKWQAVL